VDSIEVFVLEDVGSWLEVNILAGSASGEAVGSQTQTFGCGGKVDTESITELVKEFSKIEV